VPEVAVAALGRHGDPRHGRIPLATVAFGVMLFGGALFLLYAGRHLSFCFDEWDFVLRRRGGGIGTYLDSHNGHLVLSSVVIYKVLFGLVGLRNYLPYRAVTVALHLLCCALLYVIVRRRLPSRLAFVPPTLLLLMGSAYEDLLWPFQISFLISVAGGLGALALLDRHTPRADAGGAALLGVSLTGSGVGIPFALAGTAMLVAQRGSWRRLWVPALPAGLFAVWYLGWGGGEGINADAILNAPQFVSTTVTGTTAGIVGLTTAWGPPAAAAMAVVIAVAWRARHGSATTPMLFAAVAGALSFWLLFAIVRVGTTTPAAPRYLYVGAVFIWLLAAEAGVGTGISGAWLTLVGLLVGGMLLANVNDLRRGERGLRYADTPTRAALTAVELAAPVVSPSFVAEPVYAPQLTAGGYLAAIRDLGSPAMSLSELQRAPQQLRSETDGVLERAERIGVAPAPGLVTCRPLDRGSGGVIDATVAPGSTLVISGDRGATPAVYVRRLADQFASSPTAAIPTGTVASIPFPADRAPQLRWVVRIAAARAARVCVA
jgi:hypothetical protein